LQAIKSAGGDRLEVYPAVAGDGSHAGGSFDAAVVAVCQRTQVATFEGEFGIGGDRFIILVKQLYPQPYRGSAVGYVPVG